METLLSLETNLQNLLNNIYVFARPLHEILFAGHVDDGVGIFAQFVQAQAVALAAFLVHLDFVAQRVVDLPNF